MNIIFCQKSVWNKAFLLGPTYWVNLQRRYAFGYWNDATNTTRKYQVVKVSPGGSLPLAPSGSSRSPHSLSLPSLPLAPLAPSHSLSLLSLPLTPLTPSHSLSLPITPLAPSYSSLSLLLPLTPMDNVG